MCQPRWYGSHVAKKDLFSIHNIKRCASSRPSFVHCTMSLLNIRVPTELVVHGTKYQHRSGEKHLRSRLLHRSLNWMHLGVLGMPCAIIGPLAEIKDFLVYVVACILALEVSCFGSEMLNLRLQANCSNVRIIDTKSEGFLVLYSLLSLICCKMAAILLTAFHVLSTIDLQTSRSSSLFPILG